MSRFTLPSFVAALSLAASSAAALAQDPAQAPAPTQDPAPIVHQYAPRYQSQSAAPQIATTSPSPGIWVRSAPGAEVKTVATSADSVELAVTKGLANVSIHQPKENEQILVDLPGGQVALVKDGTYTFNAATNTFRVLEGEAAAFPASDAKAKPLTVKDDHAVVFGADNLHSTEFAPFQAQADILPTGQEGRGEPGYGREPGYGPGYRPAPFGYYGGPAYAYGPYGPGWGPYGDGFYGYPYYAYGYPYAGWGYPYGFGLGIGFGGYWGGGFGRGYGFRR
jgi:hypothetical protein